MVSWLHYAAAAAALIFGDIFFFSDQGNYVRLISRNFLCWFLAWGDFFWDGGQPGEMVFT